MISVITITYNNYDELVKTMASLEKSKDIESIVVNGGQCPKTQVLLNQWAKTKRNFKFVSGPDKGIADAFNKGLKLAGGEGITFLNSGDVLLQPEFYSQAQEFFLHHPNTSYIHGNIVFEDALCGDLIMVPRAKTLGRGMPYFHQTMIVRKKVFDEIGPFKIHFRIAMDYEFVCRLKTKNYQGHYWPGPPIIRMDGHGISAKREWLSIKECFLALKENALLNRENLLGITQRSVFYFGRRIFNQKRLRPLLANLKRWKYK